MNESIICAGFGGQGIMIMGKLIAQAAMAQNYNTTWMPSYGAEVRGGTAHSMVKISTEEIASPLVTNPDSCIIMNRPSFVKFIDRVKKGGLAVCNSSLIDLKTERKDIKTVHIPASDIASEMGNVKVANMIILGTYAKMRKILETDIVLKVLEELFAGKKDLVSLNKEAFKKGVSLV